MLKLDTLIEKLQAIQCEYGNLDVDVNVLGGEHYFIKNSFFNFLSFLLRHLYILNSLNS